MLGAGKGLLKDVAAATDYLHGWAATLCYSRRRGLISGHWGFEHLCLGCRIGIWAIRNRPTGLGKQQERANRRKGHLQEKKNQKRQNQTNNTIPYPSKTKPQIKTNQPPPPMAKTNPSSEFLSIHKPSLNCSGAEGPWTAFGVHSLVLQVPWGSNCVHFMDYQRKWSYYVCFKFLLALCLFLSCVCLACSQSGTLL